MDQAFNLSNSVCVVVLMNNPSSTFLNILLFLFWDALFLLTNEKRMNGDVKMKGLLLELKNGNGVVMIVPGN
ncbi:hypothetical protein VIGAN_01131000 [Vigna angularis var. angularis]|uniref:Uncharacterized protein n=1 Tax=Vigna angularis var. angularis TaxID=157739 RepID=A0A0S3QZJ5_PHAAN|nr:hypothetical protein VIGAN_01131000 [Vigna angularis var. angularis]